MICIMYLPISLRVASLALGQSYDCHSASEVTLKDMGEIDHYQTKTKHNKVYKLCVYLVWTISPITNNLKSAFHYMAI